VQGDCCGGLAASYCGGGALLQVREEPVQDCTVTPVNDDQPLHHHESSTLNDDVPRACRTLQPTTPHPHIHHHHHQQQQQRPTTYKWMTVKRGPPKTAGQSDNQSQKCV